MRSLILALGILAATSFQAFAVDLTVDLNQKILSAEGKPFTECDEASPATTTAPAKCLRSHELTFGGAAIELLEAPDPSLHGEEKAKAGYLAIKIAGELSKGKMVLTLDEAQLIKSQADKNAVTPVLDARMRQILEPAKTQ